MTLSLRRLAPIAACVAASFSASSLALASQDTSAPAAPASTPAAGVQLPAGAPTAETILAEYATSLGGKELIDSLKSWRYKADFDMIQGKSEMDVAMMLPDGVHIIQKMEGIPLPAVTGLSGSIAWSSNPVTGEVQLLDEEMVKALVGGSDFQTLMRHLERGYRDFKTSSEETFDGTACWAVSMTSLGGDAAVAFFDKSTKLLRGILTTATSGPADGETATITLRDWTEHAVGEKKLKTFHGIVVAQGAMRVSGAFKDFEFNTLDASYFEPPAKVKELAAKAAATRGAPSKESKQSGGAPNTSGNTLGETPGNSAGK
jgi:hypothetical protein